MRSSDLGDASTVGFILIADAWRALNVGDGQPGHQSWHSWHSLLSYTDIVDSVIQMAKFSDRLLNGILNGLGIPNIELNSQSFGTATCLVTDTVDIFDRCVNRSW